MYQDPYESDGITGGAQAQLIKKLQGDPLQADTPAMPAPAAPALSQQYRSQLGGFDTGKLDAHKNDPKYVFGQYAQGLNVTDPNDRAKLQDLLRNDQSGFFKNATLDKDILHGAYDPETGRSGDVDVIKGLDAGGQGWQWGAMPESVGKPVAGGAPMQGGGSPMSMLTGMLGGGDSAQGNIQQALGQFNQPGLLQQLIAQLQGGQ